MSDVRRLMQKPETVVFILILILVSQNTFQCNFIYKYVDNKIVYVYEINNDTYCFNALTFKHIYITKQVLYHPPAGKALLFCDLTRVVNQEVNRSILLECEWLKGAELLQKIDMIVKALKLF